MSRSVSHRAKTRAAPTRASFPGRLNPSLLRDRRGVTAVEFALIAPVLCVLLLGSMDIAHTLYMRAVLQGIVQKTARDAGLETADEDALDDKVRAQALTLANNATVNITRSYYRSYADAATGQFEPFTDTDHDGTCDHGEPYEDNNGNGQWDKTFDNASQGGAKDAVLYTATVSYPRMFPMTKLLGWSAQSTVTASTVLRNQPYGDQVETVVRKCS